MRRLEEGFRKKDATFGSIFLQVGPPATWKELIKNKFIRIMSSNLKLMKMHLVLQFPNIKEPGHHLHP